MINLLLLVFGTFMDMAPMLLIATPIFLPIVIKFGVDPVHFGIIMILNLGIGLLTPPVGSTLAVGCAVGKVTMEEMSRSILDLLHAAPRRAGARHLRSGAFALAAGAVQVLRTAANRQRLVGSAFQIAALAAISANLVNASATLPAISA